MMLAASIVVLVASGDNCSSTKQVVQQATNLGIRALLTVVDSGTGQHTTTWGTNCLTEAWFNPNSKLRHCLLLWITGSEAIFIMMLVVKLSQHTVQKGGRWLQYLDLCSEEGLQIVMVVGTYI